MGQNESPKAPARVVPLHKGDRIGDFLLHSLDRAHHVHQYVRWRWSEGIGEAGVSVASEESQRNPQLLGPLLFALLGKHLTESIGVIVLGVVDVDHRQPTGVVFDDRSIAVADVEKMHL